MTAFSDETGRDALAALAEQCREILEWHKTGKLADGEVRRLASTMQESIPEHTRLHIAENKIATEAMKYVRQAALSASPVAQEPVMYQARFRDQANALQKGWFEIGKEAFNANLTKAEYRALYTSPPATPAGLGADEIARAKITIADMLSGTSFPLRVGPWHEEMAAKIVTVAILALLSRAGDQSNSTQKDGSR